MALFKRKRSASSAPRKRSRRAFKRTFGMRKSRVIRKMDMIPHAFSRYVNDESWYVVNASSSTFSNGLWKSGTAVTGGSLVDQFSLSMAFTMQDLPAWAEFSNLYDQYRLNYVVVTLKLVQNPNSAFTTNVATGQNVNAATSYTNPANWYPTIWMVRDHDDVNAITLNDIKQYSTVKHKVLAPNREIKFTVKPSIKGTAYSGSSVVSDQILYKRWQDVANNLVPHYGVKFVCDCEGLTTTVQSQFTIKVDAKYYFQMKHSR